MSEFRGRIVTSDGVVEGVLSVDGDRIASVTPGPVDSDAWIVPGFVDIHCHGGGGHTFTTGDAEAARAAAAFHAGHGATTVLASLVSSPFEVMLAATRAYAPLVAEGVIGGVHFEGPYLSEACCGAQNPAYLRDPSRDEIGALIDAGGPGTVRMMTIAPERAGALDAIGFMTSRGTVAAIGHTDATYGETVSGLEAGATAGTHVFNGMRPPHHRAPGPVYALLGSGAVCEFVADGVHLADETLEFAMRVTGPGRAVLITDAIAATGMADGGYELGGQAVTVSGGVARLTTADGSEGVIAGSTLTMDAAFRRAARVTGSVVAAARAASTTPARAVGLLDRGELKAGLRADLLVLDGDLEIRSVIRSGAPVR